MNPMMMDRILLAVAMLLLLTMLLGMVRIWRGPDLADRMLTAQLFGTTGITLLLVLGELAQQPHLRNAAFILALLAMMSSVAFVSRVWRADRGPEQEAAKGGEE